MGRRQAGALARSTRAVRGMPRAAPRRRRRRRTPLLRPSAVLVSRSGERARRRRRPTRSPPPTRRRTMRSRSVASLRFECENHERNPELLGQRAERLPLRAPEKGRVDDGNASGIEDVARKRAEAIVGRVGRTPTHTALARCPRRTRSSGSDAVHSLALDIAADAHRSDLSSSAWDIVVLPHPESPQVMMSAGRRPLRVASTRAAGSRATRRSPRSSLAPRPTCAARSRRDLGANERTVREIERQHREPRIVARPLEIRVQKAVREIGTTAILQIHHGEGDFAHHVDPAHLLVEFDAIEDDELAVDARDVAQMEVAMALAHEAPLRRRRKASRRAACSRSVQRAEVARARRAPVPWPATGRSRKSSAAQDAEFHPACRTPHRRGDADRSRERRRPWPRACRCRRRRARHARAIGSPARPAEIRASSPRTRVAGPAPPITGASTLPVIGTTSR